MSQEMELQKFVNQDFGEIRGLSFNDQPWLIGKDVALCLGYKKPENALITHVDGEDKTTTLFQGSGSNYKSKTTIINESGFYSLVFGSKLLKAKEFKHWITAEVLPQIRKTGGYIPIKPEDDEKTVMARGYMVAMKTIEKKDELIHQLIPKATAYDDLMNTNGYLQFIDIAQTIEIGRTKLFDVLRKYKVLTKQSKYNVPYGRFAKNGYFKVVVSNRNGITTPVTLVSPSGLNYIYKLIKKNQLEDEFDMNKLVSSSKLDRTVA